MPREICPYCSKKVTFPYGRNVFCPQCGGKVNVFDDEHPLGRKLVDFGYRVTSLFEYTPEKSWNGNVERMVPKRDAKMRKLPRDLFPDPALERKIRVTQIGLVQGDIAEMEMFVNEGIFCAIAELERLKEKLSLLLEST